MKVRVRFKSIVTIEVESSWSDGCDISQVRDQATTAAQNRLQKMRQECGRAGVHIDTQELQSVVLFPE